MRLIECRCCDATNCEGCNMFTLAQMLQGGELDCLMDEHHSIVIAPESLRAKGRYTANEVAEIIAELFGDRCACNFNGIDEWLPDKCELIDSCPDTVGVACWEQYLKYRDAKMEV